MGISGKSISPGYQWNSFGSLVYKEHDRRVVCTSKVECNWYFVNLKSGFHVLDGVLVDNREGSFKIYGIQITISKDPFQNHNTLETCTDESKVMLDDLWQAIYRYFNVSDSPEPKYLMIAPRCSGNGFRPPAGHRSELLFSPVTTELMSNLPAKPRETRAAGEQPIPEEEKQTKKHKNSKKKGPSPTNDRQPDEKRTGRKTTKKDVTNPTRDEQPAVD